MAIDHDVTDRDDLAVAVGLYALGEVSIGRAAEIADLTRWEFVDLLEDAGIPTRLGPQTVEEAREDVETALDVE